MRRIQSAKVELRIFLAKPGNLNCYNLSVKHLSQTDSVWGNFVCGREMANRNG